MNAARAYSELRRMGKAVFTTKDAALRLGLSVPATSLAMGRLQYAGLAQRIVRGLWTLDREIDPLVIPEYLTAPFPAYVSLYSALYYHGMIGQIPQMIYVVSLGLTRKLGVGMVKGSPIPEGYGAGSDHGFESRTRGA